MSKLEPLPPRSDAALLLALFVGIALCGVLGVLCIASLLIEIGYRNRPSGTLVDLAEMATAKQLVSERSVKLNEWQQQAQRLSGRIESQRVSVAELKAKELRAIALGEPSSQSPTPTEAPPPRYSASAASVLYSATLRQGNSIDTAILNQISKLSVAELAEYGDLLALGFESRQLEAAVSAVALRATSNKECQQRFVRAFIKRPDPLGGAQSVQEPADLAATLFDFCLLLPNGERADAIRQVSLLYLSADQQIAQEFRRAINGLPPEELDVLAPLIAHPNQEISEYITPKLTTDAAMKAAVNHLGGDDYLFFVHANRWLSLQPVHPKHRADVLKSLSAVLLVPDEGQYLTLSNFARWADDSVVGIVDQYLRKPLRNPNLIDSLIDIALQQKWPVSDMIADSAGQVSDQWFTRYLTGDPVIRNAYQEILLREPPAPSSLVWFARISKYGDQAQLSDLEQVIDKRRLVSPSSEWLTRAERLVEQMRTRLK